MKVLHLSAYLDFYDDANQLHSSFRNVFLPDVPSCFLMDVHWSTKCNPSRQEIQGQEEPSPGGEAAQFFLLRKQKKVLTAGKP